MTSLLIASSGGFWAPIADPIASVLAFFYSLVPNYGIAIVLLTIAMMIVLIPLTIKQTRSMLVMQKLQPAMKRLQEQHKNDRQALNEAVMALYKEHNASPLGGCLPMLLPFPLFIALYRVLEGLSHLSHKVSQPEYLSKTTRMYQDIVNAKGHLNSFGLDLAKTARNAGGGFVHSLPYFVLLLLMVGTQFYQQYQLTSKNPAMKSQPGQAMMMKVIPLVFGVISLAFPAGLIVYWTVSNIFRIGQQWALYRYDPKVKALVSEDVKEVEAKTREIDEASSAKPTRPRFRDLLNNASQAAERRTTPGKGDAGPGSRPGDRNGSGRSTTPGGTKKATGSPPAKAGGAQKSSPQKGTGPKAPLAKAAPGKPAIAKAGAPKPGAAKAGAPKPAANAGASKPGAEAKPGGPARTATPAKTSLPNKTNTSTPAAANGNGGSAPIGVGGPTSGTGATGNGANGRPKAPVAGTGANDGQDGVETTPNDRLDGAEGTPAASDDRAPSTNGAPKGRTGGGRTGAGNARTISGNRRRKGR